MELEYIINMFLASESLWLKHLVDATYLQTTQRSEDPQNSVDSDTNWVVVLGICELFQLPDVQLCP